MSLKKNSKNNSRAVKAICIVLVSALLLGLVPADALSGLVMNTQAAYVPDYDPALGSYTIDGSTLTAIPADSCGFRGWYKDGKEVSASKTFTMPTGGSADDYTPVFYDFNLIENGGFEGSTPGVDLKDSNLFGSETWGGDSLVKVTVSNDKARSGNNSAKIVRNTGSAIYRYITGLEKNAQYKLSFYYNIEQTDANTSQPYLKYVSLHSESTYLGEWANYKPDEKQNLDDVYFADATSGGCEAGEWKKVTLSFCTFDTTDFKLAFLYDYGGDTATGLYIDDMVLVKDELGTPTYANDDFSTPSVANWSVPSGKFEIGNENGWLKTQTPTAGGGTLVSAPFWVKKGCEYKISFTVDLRGLHNYVRKYDHDNGEFVKDANGDFVYETAATGAQKVNTFSFYVGEAAEKSLSDVPATLNINNNVGYSETVPLDKTTFSEPPTWYVNKSQDKVKDEDVENVTCSITFTAPESQVLYFSTKLTGYETYAIDNFKVEETQYNGIKEDYAEDTLKTIGTAIRTSGNQGIRHKTEIDKRLLCDDGYFGIRVKEYGTVAMRNDILNGAELTVNNGVVGAAYKLADNIDVRFEETKNGIQYTGVLINISENYWNTDFTMCGYIKYDLNGTEKVLYSDPIDSSIYLVSKFAYSAKTPTGEFAESDKIRDYLYTTILSKYRDKNISINDNNSIYTNFQGISSTVYHCYTFMKDEHNRQYTDEQAKIEMDRLVDSGIDNVRTAFKTQFAWDDTLNDGAGGWNWDSELMQAVYKWAKMLQDRGITITINAGWTIYDFMAYADHYYDKDGDGEIESELSDYSSIKEWVRYIKDLDLPDLYGETEGLDIDTTDGVTQEEFYAVASARYGEWMKQALIAFKEHGVNNVKYLMLFTEPGKSSEFEHPDISKTGKTSYWEWLRMSKALHDALKKAGIRNDYLLVGPNQTINVDTTKKIEDEYDITYQTMIEYYLEQVEGTEYEGMIDIISSHHYPKPDTANGYEDTIYEPYACYSWADKNSEYFKNIREKTGLSDQEFWCDEYFTYASDAHRIEDIGVQMTQFAACLTAGINTGTNRFLSWQLFDTLWFGSTGTTGANNTEKWIGGVHVCGTAPSLIDTSKCTNGSKCACHRYDKYASETPRKLYYGLNLLGKYLNNKNGTVVESIVTDNNYDSKGGLYVSSIINDENRLVVLVANTTNRPTNFNLNLESGFEAKFTRYTYNPDGITPTKEAKSIPSDGYITSTEGNFYDTLAPGSFAFYISEIRDLGDDVIIDMGGLMP